MDQAAFGRQGAAGACSIAPRTKPVEAAFLRIERAQFFHSNGPPRLRRRYDAKCGATCPLISDHRGVELGPFSPPSFFDRSSLGPAPPSKARWGRSRFHQNGNQSNMSDMSGDSGGSGAAACSGSSCDCDSVVLGVGDPRTSGYHLPAAPQLVSPGLGIDGALSVRHLSLWTFLLSRGLPLCGSSSVPTSVNLCRRAGPSPAVSASRVVVVIKVRR
jgi:hypothetical protein